MIPNLLTQILPPSKASLQKEVLNRKRPSKGALDHYEPETKLDTMSIMQDSLIAGSLNALGIPFDPEMEDDYPKAFEPTPGRCNWTWDTLMQLDCFQQHDLNLQPLLAASLRPSSALPRHIQGTSPRLAAVTLGMNWSALNRCLNTISETYNRPIVRYSSLYSGMQTHSYGIDIDRFIEPKQEQTTTAMTKGTRRTILVHYALTRVPRQTPRGMKELMGYTEPDLEEDDEDDFPIERTLHDTPFSTALWENPPIDIDIGQGLYKDFLRAVQIVCDQAQQALDQNTAHARDLPTLHYVLQADLKVFAEVAIDDFLRGGWYWPNTTLPRDATIAALSRAMVTAVHQRKGTNRRLTASTLIPLSVLTGVPVSTWLVYNLHHLERTAYSLFTENCIESLKDWVRIQRPKTETQKTNQSALMDELNTLSAQTTRLLDNLDPDREAAVTEAVQERSMPMWGIENYWSMEDDDE